MKTAATNRDDVIERCRQAEPDIRRLGVRRIALFGSLVRGEANADSDVDLLVEFEAGSGSDHCKMRKDQDFTPRDPTLQRLSDAFSGAGRSV